MLTLGELERSQYRTEILWMQVAESTVWTQEGDSTYPAGLRISKPESVNESSEPSQLRVLVVDDERLLAETTAAILNLAGFSTKIAFDGFAALEVARSFRPDLLLSDIMMPEMNGVELAIAITRMYPAIKTLLYSGQTGIAKILEESRAQGFEFPLLAKPVHPSKLIEGLKSLANS
jgi:CheY-like chemotaxis protein